MLLRPTEFTHASEKFEFTTKGLGARGAGRSLRSCRCPYHFVGWAAVANQFAAAWMWLAGAMPLSTVHSNSLLYFSVILRNQWFSLGNNKCFWKENEKLYCENYWQCFRKNDGGGLFPLIWTSNLFTTIIWLLWLKGYFWQPLARPLTRNNTRDRKKYGEVSEMHGAYRGLSIESRIQPLSCLHMVWSPVLLET